MSRSDRLSIDSIIDRLWFTDCPTNTLHGSYSNPIDRPQCLFARGQHRLYTTESLKQKACPVRSNTRQSLQDMKLGPQFSLRPLSFTR
jgi:hypothetical protein